MQISRLSIGVLGMLLCVFTNGVRGMENVTHPEERAESKGTTNQQDEEIKKINEWQKRMDEDMAKLKKTQDKNEGAKEENTEEEDNFLQKASEQQIAALGAVIGISAAVEHYAKINNMSKVKKGAEYCKHIGLQSGVGGVVKVFRDENYFNNSAFGDLEINLAANVTVNAVLDHTKVGKKISSTCKEYVPDIAGSETVAKGVAGYGAYHYVAKPIAEAALEYGKTGVMKDARRIAKNATTEKDGKTLGALVLAGTAVVVHVVAKRYAQNNKVVQAFTKGFAAGSIVQGGHTIWISNREVSDSSTTMNKVISAVVLPTATGGVRAGWEYLKQKNLLPEVVKNTVEGIADNIPVPEELQEAVLPGLISFAWVYGVPYVASFMKT